MTYKEYRKLEDAVQNLIDYSLRFCPRDTGARTAQKARTLGYLDVMDILRTDFDPSNNKEEK